MTLSFQSKIQPVSAPAKSGSLSFADKVKPVAPIAPVAPAPMTRNALSSTPVVGQLSDAGIGAGTAIAKTLTGIPEAMSRGIGGALGGLAKIGPTGVAQKVLGGIGQSFDHNADKIAQYKEDQFAKPYQSSLETVSGQAGTIAGNVAPYFLTGPALAATKAPLLARAAAAVPSVLADTAISQAQSGGDLATGGATAITSAVGNMIVPGGGGLAKRMLKGAVPGYTGDVAMGMAGQRGEDRTGAKAFVPGLGTALGAGFSGAGYIKSPERKVARAEKTIKGREAVLQRLEDNYSTIKKVTENASKRGIDPKKLLAGGDLLVGSVDNAGTIRTTGEGGAIEQLNNFIKPQENIVSKKLQQEGATIPLTEVHKQLKRAVMDSGLQGGALTRALQNVESDIAGYAMRADGSGNIPLSTVHSAKVDKYANINYLNPESKRADKVIAKTLKRIVEDNSSVEVKKLNEELSRHYAALNLLEKLDGKKVEGGRLGKLFAQTIGGMVGSHFGPLGTIAGAEIGGAAKGAMMKSTFGKKTGNNLVRSELMNKNIQSTDTALGMRNQSQSTQKITTSPTGITPTVLPKTPKPKPVVPITEPSRLLAEPSKATPLGGETIAGKVDASGSLIPHRVGKSGVSLVPAEKGMVGVDPKTKKFMRTYKSGFASRTAINTLGGAATGALAGVETDQNGKKTYNLKKGLGGAVVGGALGYGVSKGKLGLSMEDITKNLSKEDTKYMQDFIDSVNTGKPTKEVALNASRVAEAMKLNEVTGTDKQLAKKFAEILDAKKTDPTRSVPIKVEPSSIAQEAKKYKTAEEFVKAQPTYFHSTKAENVASIEQNGFSGKIGELSGKSGGKMESGVFLYDTKPNADAFGKNFSSPATIETAVNGKVYDANTQTKYGWEDNLQTQEIAKDPKIIAQLRKDGYVGVKSTELGTPATFVFEPSAVQTNSQLTDIWKKANQATDLLTEAKKYKTAEDFADATVKLNEGQMSSDNRLIAKAVWKLENKQGLTTQQSGMKDAIIRIAKEQDIPISKDGNLVLYHGTKVGRAPKEGDTWRVGSYFTSKPEVARQFAGQGEGGAIKIMRVEVPPQTIFNSGDGTYFTLNEPIPVRSNAELKIFKPSQLTDIWKQAHSQ